MLPHAEFHITKDQRRNIDTFIESTEGDCKLDIRQFQMKKAKHHPIRNAFRISIVGDNVHREIAVIIAGRTWINGQIGEIERYFKAKVDEICYREGKTKNKVPSK
jgi:hypothetical protein